jgi:putative MATE family efflux protein
MLAITSRRQSIGSLWSVIWNMSWPLVIATMGVSLIGAVDVRVAGLLGPTAQAAVGLAEHVLSMFNMFIISIGVGTTAIVARAAGAKNHSEVEYSTAQSITLSLLMGLLLSCFAAWSAHFVIPCFAQDPAVVSQGVMYLGIYALYMVPFSLVCISNSALRAIGAPGLTVAIVLTELLVNIFGDYATVIGNWPVAGLGIRGIACASIAGAASASCVAALCIWHSPLKLAFHKLLPMSIDAAMRVLRIGVPAAIHGVTWALSVFLIFFILKAVHSPTAALASWAIGMRVEALLLIPLIALRLSVASIVGQSLGARQTAVAVRAGWNVAGIAVVLMFALGTIVFMFAKQIVAAFSSDATTIEYTTSFLCFGAIALPFRGLDAALSGALQGAGDTRAPMWILMFTNWIIRLPLAWLLCIKLECGPPGAWMAIAISGILAAVLICLRYAQGSWTKQAV